MSGREHGAETVRPVSVDNRDGNTSARAIRTHLATLRMEGRIPAELCVASCYFNRNSSPPAGDPRRRPEPDESVSFARAASLFRGARPSPHASPTGRADGNAPGHPRSLS